MPLFKSSSSVKKTFVNISKGKFFTRESGKDPIFYGELEGYITSINFKNDEYNGKEFEILQVHISDETDNFIVQMRTDSGYFRTFCNALKSGDIYKKFRFSPYYKEENGKPKTVLFLKQNSIPLKFYHTQKNMGDLPPLEKINFKGQEHWDGTKQINFWKDYLSSLNFLPVPENSHITAIDLVTEKKDNEIAPKSIPEDFNDDLPF
jgi:hypothetical protein